MGTTPNGAGPEYSQNGSSGGGAPADGSITTAKIADSAVTTAKINARAVTYAKLQAIATARVLGRTTAGSGDAEELTAAQTRGLIGLPTAFTTAGAMLRVNAGATGYEEFMAYTVGHTWSRTTPSTAGGGAVFLDEDTRQEYVSSGDDTIGWSVRLPTRLGSDRAGLLMGAGTIYLGSLDLSAYTVGAVTVAVLFTMTGAQDGSWSAVAVLGASAGPTGMQIGLIENGGNTELRAYSNGGNTLLATYVTADLLSAPLHAACVTATTHDFGGGVVDAWRWSFDGSAAAYTEAAASYLAPDTSDEVGAWSRSGGARLVGEGHDLAIWNAELTGAQLAALTTLPGTATYRLPITSGMGVPDIRVEAGRYDPTLPDVLPALGLALPLTVGAAVRKVDH